MRGDLHRHSSVRETFDDETAERAYSGDRHSERTALVRGGRLRLFRVRGDDLLRDV